MTAHRHLADQLSSLTPCGPGELGPVCNGPALLDAATSVAASPQPTPAVTVVLEAGEPHWYYLADVLVTSAGALVALGALVVSVALGVSAVRAQNELREEQRQAQAQRVTLVRHIEARGGDYLVLRNDSPLPITGVRVVAVGAYVEELVEMAGHMAPGAVEEYFYRGTGHRFNVAVAEFDDASGRTWIRTADGGLEQIAREYSRSGLAVYSAPAHDNLHKVVEIWAKRRAGGPLTSIDLKASSAPPERWWQPIGRAGRNLLRMNR